MYVSGTYTYTWTCFYLFKKINIDLEYSYIFGSKNISNTFWMKFKKKWSTIQWSKLKFKKKYLKKSIFFLKSYFFNAWKKILKKVYFF